MIIAWRIYIPFGIQAVKITICRNVDSVSITVADDNTSYQAARVICVPFYVCAVLVEVFVEVILAAEE